MKEWFKYEFGYVNINTENLFLTNSGNWSETHNLLEKTKKNANKNNLKRVKIIVFFVVVLSFLFFSMYNNRLAIKAGSLFVFITIGFGYKMYNYLKTEMDAKFKIPLRKMEQIQISGNSVVLLFLDGEGMLCKLPLNHVSEKGLIIMTALQTRMVFPEI